jgi:choice-of-anchor A domain-containing protein
MLMGSGLQNSFGRFQAAEAGGDCLDRASDALEKKCAMRWNQIAKHVAFCSMTFALMLAVLPASAGTINLGGAADYAVLGIGGTTTVRSDFEVYQSDTVVTGNVGVGPYSTFTHGMDGTITGRLDYDTTDTLPSITGTIGGGTFQKPMAGIVQDALNASTFYAGLAPTQTFATLTEGQTITGNGGMNVIRITGAVTLKQTFNLVGGPSDIFVFQLTSDHKDVLTLSGVIMNLVGVNAANILWDLNGEGDDISITSGAIVYGTFLAPNRSITVDHGNILGRVIGGGPMDNFLSIHSGSQITIPNPPVGAEVPLPPTAWAGLGLMGVLGASKLRRRRQVA